MVSTAGEDMNVRRPWTGRGRAEPWEGPALRRTREILCAGARERTLEVGVGTGANLRYYPPQVRLTAIDTDSAALASARKRSEELGLVARFTEGDALSLDFPDEGFETVVCMLALDTVDDRARALREMYRVLVPGGRLLAAERIPRARLLPRLSARRREHRRAPREEAAEAGFRVGHHDRLFFGTVERMVAHRP
ncbi:Ubiquinone/menaquinone biosynthesis C-methylase UbiE [Nocardiopsis flavescens]|uniref:Ubiquinone/menaquinone biosynthesis C-methylase UbiE n=2 Tax=Nocardiopsis flavescens TaxID=758803 RepID=A0A1M6I778_9ACTN|nr:Ubiquinone/menaquinone biosynthesis C-methylase UbiE [Nocardiopsis flavescens]